MADIIEVVRGDARSNLGGRDIQHLPGQPADLAHGLLTLGVQRHDLGPVEASLTLWYARLGPVRVRDGLGDLAPW